jgi:hypothetical protein
VLAASLDATHRPPPSATSTRRIITVEVLNPIELAGTRGRIAGIAGSFAPGITRRIVYDQVLGRLRKQLADEKVVADVRLHVLRPVPAPERAAVTPSSVTAPGAAPSLTEFRDPDGPTDDPPPGY